MKGRYFVRQIHRYGEEWVGSGYVPPEVAEQSQWTRVVLFCRQLETFFRAPQDKP